MRWSKVRKLVEDTFAESVRGRVTVHSTSYRQPGVPFACGCTTGWFAVDGEPLVHFDAHLSYRIHGASYHEATGLGPQWSHPPVPDEARHDGRLIEPGEFSGYDFNEACWTYIHSSLNDSLASTNPIVVALAVLNRKVGKHRLRRLAERDDLHPLPRHLLALRLHTAADSAISSAVRSLR
jgi:hypothetical protein